MQRPGTGDLVQPPRAGQRIDRPPLPGQAADHGVGPQRAGGLRRGKRADDIAPSADADDEDPLSGGDQTHPLAAALRSLQVLL